MNNTSEPFSVIIIDSLLIDSMIVVGPNSHVNKPKISNNTLIGTSINHINQTLDFNKSKQNIKTGYKSKQVRFN